MTDTDALEQELRTAAVSGLDRPLPELAEPAAETGLLDIGYATVETPLGELLLAATPRGLLRLAYLGDAGTEPVLEQLARLVSPRVLSAPLELEQPRRQLDEYFEGRRRTFQLPLDWRLTHGFTRRVLRATAQIPYGSVSSYGRVAAAAGSPRAWRAAGNALGSNPLPIVVPCHRVLHSDGGLGGYTGGVQRKRVLLGVEGAEG